MRFHFHTYGCQMNERDAEAAAALLVRHGHTIAGQERDADVIIVNTCSVRGKAEEKATGKLGLLVAGRRDRPGRIVGVMGCMVQRLGHTLFDLVPGVDFAVGTRALARLPAVVERVAHGERGILDTGEDVESTAAVTDHLPGAHSAFVNILFGCDRRCAYCVVPTVRGGEWSRPAIDVIREVERLGAAGVREVTLLGQSVMSYGRRQDVWAGGPASPAGFREPLPRLLEAVNGIDGIRRIRFTSGHPVGCTPELARAMAALPAVCEHLHMPLQSGSDRILERMGRGYTTDDYRTAVRLLREAMAGFSLTTDIIVGFPGETGQDFEATCRFVEEIGFDNAFVFKYSARPGTRAAAWDDDVPVAEKARRNQALLAQLDRQGQERNDRLVGSIQEVLVEGRSLRNARTWSGRTRGNKIVVFEPVAGVQAGDVVRVTIDRARPQTLYGAVVSRETGSLS